MTTIAVRDGVMAADTRGDQCGRLAITRKLFQIDGAVVGICGYWSDGKIFADWYAAGSDMAKPPDWRVQACSHWSRAELTPDGDLLVVGVLAKTGKRGLKDRRFVALYDWSGARRWRRALGAHHDAEVREKVQCDLCRCASAAYGFGLPGTEAARCISA